LGSFREEVVELVRLQLVSSFFIRLTWRGYPETVAKALKKLVLITSEKLK